MSPARLSYHSQISSRVEVRMLHDLSGTYHLILHQLYMFQYVVLFMFYLCLPPSLCFSPHTSYLFLSLSLSLFFFPSFALVYKSSQGIVRDLKTGKGKKDACRAVFVATCCITYMFSITSLQHYKNRTLMQLVFGAESKQSSMGETLTPLSG